MRRACPALGRPPLLRLWPFLFPLLLPLCACSLIANPDSARLYPLGPPCPDASGCDDSNDCTTDRCVDGYCSSRLLDADGDGHVPLRCSGDDCNDTEPAIFPGAAEQCADGADNDCDGLTDFDDPACEALALNDTCAAAAALRPGDVLNGDSSVYTDNYAARCLSPSPGAGRDGVFYFDLAAEEEVDIDTFGSSIDTVLSIRTSCVDAAAEIACANNVNPALTTRLLVRRLAAGRYYLVLDTDRNNAAGTYLLRFNTRAPRPPLNCGNTIDLSRGAVVYGTTAGGADNASAGCGGAGAPDEVYTLGLTAPVSHVIAHTHQSDFDTVLYIRAACAPGVDLQCSDNDTPPALTSGFNWSPIPPANYFLYLDGNGSAGDYRLTVWVEP